MEKNYGDKIKRVVDMSPFFFFEAAGDSEGDFDHHNMMVMMMGGLDGDHHGHDNDAQSCSHDAWVDIDASPIINGIDQAKGSSRDNLIIHHDKHGHHDDDDDKPIKWSKRGHDGHDDNTWRGNNNNNNTTSEIMSTANSHRSRNSCVVDSSEMKKMSEKERSRLFWEACLAS